MSDILAEREISVMGHRFKEADRPQPVSTELGMLANILDRGYNADPKCYRNWYGIQKARDFLEKLRAAGYGVERQHEGKREWWPVPDNLWNYSAQFRDVRTGECIQARRLQSAPNHIQDERTAGFTDGDWFVDTASDNPYLLSHREFCDRYVLIFPPPAGHQESGPSLEDAFAISRDLYQRNAYHAKRGIRMVDQPADDVLKHMAEEVQELRDAPDDEYELADILCLAAAYAARKKWNPERLACAMIEKLRLRFPE